MAKTCPTCKVQIAGSAKPAPAWLPIVTVVGVSAAAYLVYRKVRSAQSGGMESILDHCARAAHALEQRIGDGFSSLAG